MFSLALLFFICSGSCLCSFDVPSVRVLSPSEFDVVLPSDNAGRLADIRINVNKPLGAEEPHYKKGNLHGRIIHFSDGNLKLKRGDVVYYSMLLDDGDQGIHGQDGNYIFDGVYKRKDRRRREVYEQGSEDSSSSEEDSKEKDSDPRQGRYFHHGRPRGRFGPHGHHHHFGPHHFFPPPFGAPHHPHSFPGPGAWKDRGYDPKNKFGNHGPWDGHDSGDCDSSEHKPKRPGHGQGPDNRGPWRGDDPYPDNNGDKNDGKNGFGRPFSERPSVGSDERDNKPTEDPNVEIFTTKRPSTTARTTTTTTPVPNIDIRYRIPEES